MWVPEYSVASSQFYVVSQKFHTKKIMFLAVLQSLIFPPIPVDHNLTNMANVSHMQANKDKNPTQPYSSGKPTS